MVNPSMMPFKVIESDSAMNFEEQLNAAGSIGWKISSFQVTRTIGAPDLFVAVMFK